MRPTIRTLLVLNTLLFLVYTSIAKSEGEIVEGALSFIQSNEISKFAEIYSNFKGEYISELNDHDMMNQCIIGMVSGIDPDSAYISKTELEELTSDKVGVGLDLMIKEIFPVVVTSIDESPAWVAGIQNGDVLLSIDNINTNGKTMNQINHLMLGKSGSTVSLKVASANNGEVKSLKLSRAVTKIKAIKEAILIQQFAYIRVATLEQNTGDKLERTINELKKKNDTPLKGLVLDLRSNSGGSLTAAVEIVDHFLEKGVILKTNSRNKSKEFTFSARDGDILNGAPIVVLVDGGSAAGAEIIAASLQDHQRGLILGRRTFGRARLQKVIHLKNDDVLKVTTSTWLTPKGRVIQGVGVEPDIEILTADMPGRVNSQEKNLDIPTKRAIEELKRMANF